MGLSWAAVLFFWLRLLGSDACGLAGCQSFKNCVSHWVIPWTDTGIFTIGTVPENLGICFFEEVFLFSSTPAFYPSLELVRLLYSFSFQIFLSSNICSSMQKEPATYVVESVWNNIHMFLGMLLGQSLLD